MGEVELTGDAWRGIAGPIGDAAEAAMAALVASAPGARSVIDAARQLGADHLPLATLVAVLADARHEREAQVAELLGSSSARAPFVVGLTGGVAVGKSMAAGAVAALLTEQLDRPAVVVTTDGFLRSNAELDARGLMSRKGFPESYDQAALLAFLDGIRAGRDDMAVPLYDHLASDVLAGPGFEVGRPEVLVLEGVNVLQPAPTDQPDRRLVSDHLDFSIYVDADEALMHTWFTGRLLDLRGRPAGEVPSFFAPMAGLSEADFLAMTDAVWAGVNRPNLVDHIAPTRDRAHLVLEKAADHTVDRVIVREV